MQFLLQFEAGSATLYEGQLLYSGTKIGPQQKAANSQHCDIWKWSFMKFWSLCKVAVNTILRSAALKRSITVDKKSLLYSCPCPPPKVNGSRAYNTHFSFELYYSCCDYKITSCKSLQHFSTHAKQLISWFLFSLSSASSRPRCMNKSLSPLVPCPYRIQLTDIVC